VLDQTELNDSEIEDIEISITLKDNLYTCFICTCRDTEYLFCLETDLNWRFSVPFNSRFSTVQLYAMACHYLMGMLTNPKIAICTINRSFSFYDKVVDLPEDYRFRKELYRPEDSAIVLSFRIAQVEQQEKRHEQER
jgi:hypothetical protein